MACAPCQAAALAKATAEAEFRTAVANGDAGAAVTIAKRWGFVVGAGIAAMAGAITKERLVEIVAAQSLAPPSPDTEGPTPVMAVNAVDMTKKPAP